MCALRRIRRFRDTREEANSIRPPWLNLLWLVPIGVVVLIVAVAAAQGLRNIPVASPRADHIVGHVLTAEARFAIPLSR